MASKLGLPPPPEKHRPTAPTMITDIGDTSFVRSSSSSHPYRASSAPSSPAAPSSTPSATASRCSTRPRSSDSSSIPAAPPSQPSPPLRRRSDPDLAAVNRGADFLLTRILEDNADSTPGLQMHSCHGGYVVLLNDTTNQIAAYNPLTQALDIIPVLHEEILLAPFFEFHIVISEEDQGVFRMVGVRHRDTSQQVPACIVLFSSATREWKVLP